MRLVLFGIRHAAKRAAYQGLEGRLIERGHPERGRLLRHDVKQILDRARRELDQLVSEANLERLPSRGNRHNVLLALFTVAAYQAIVKRGIERTYAAELLADVGWKLYAKMVAVPRLIARLVYRDPQQQLNLILRMFMIYPFSAPGRPGYEVEAWSETDRYCTFWTHCPPLQAVRDYVHLAHLIRRIPATALKTPCRISGGDSVTLGFLLEDYVVHLRHHLQQIRARRAA